MATVLLVDSDPATSARSVSALQSVGCSVEVARDIMHAGTAVLQRPDLMLVGDSMATSEGFGLVGRMFSFKTTADIPVIIMAGGLYRYDAAKRSGARAVLTAPVPDDVLVATVAAHIEKPGAITRAPEEVLTDERRLAAVTALRTAPTEQAALDRFTELASEMLAAPLSTITLLEQDRQFIVARTAVDRAPKLSSESSLDYSYCQFPVTSRQPLRVDDSALHPLVRDNLAHTELGLVAYLGIPIITADDQAVGAFCVMDSDAREWSDHDVEVLNELAVMLTEYFTTVTAKPGRHSAV